MKIIIILSLFPMRGDQGKILFKSFAGAPRVYRRLHIRFDAKQGAEAEHGRGGLSSAHRWLGMRDDQRRGKGDSQ